MTPGSDPRIERLEQRLTEIYALWAADRSRLIRQAEKDRRKFGWVTLSFAILASITVSWWAGLIAFGVLLWVLQTPGLMELSASSLPSPHDWLAYGDAEIEDHKSL